MVSKATYTLVPSDPVPYSALPYGSLYAMVDDPTITPYSKQGLPNGLDAETRATFLALPVLPLKYSTVQ